MPTSLRVLPAALISILALQGCGGGDEGAVSAAPLARMSPATGASLQACADLATRATLADTALTSATLVAAGELQVAGKAVGEHCVVRGKMHERASTLDGQTYAIGFEMRLPRDWNGRFFYQGNGGLDGLVSPAVGAVSGGGALTHALHMGFAVISSDAGHNSSQNPLFGRDPQARLDYGYQAVAKLTPMAKSLIRTAYGKAPDRSYIGGTSNGGRHVLVAASRMPDQYDGFLASAPGFNLPKAAVAQLFGAQQYARVASDSNDLSTAFNATERSMVADRILAKCDALDGAADDMVQDVEACRSAFDLIRDVPSCTAGRNGSCLTAAQKSSVNSIYSGARNSRGEALYSSFPYDPGLTSTDWANWEFTYSVTNRDPVSVGFVFQVPPADASMMNNARDFALNFNMDTDAPKIFATDATYSESAMSFMTPPNPTKLQALRDRGAKMLVVHGVSDAVFSSDDTVNWYKRLEADTGRNTADFARLFLVPGMGHSRGGPATDQFDMLSALVNWVERGQAPERVLAHARGAGNAGGVNPEVPATWAADRSRPLCAYPKVARYQGSGSIELAENFRCQ